MEVVYTKEEYNALQKELCYLNNDFNQLIQTVCSDSFWNQFDLQANATCSAIGLLDRMKNFLAQMNFITCNVVESRMGKENSNGFNIGGDNNSNIVGDSSGDDMELYNASEGNSTVLEDGKTGDETERSS